MFLFVPLSKSNFFTRVVRVALVLHSCSARVSLVSHSLVLQSICIRVARVALLFLVSGTRVVKWAIVLQWG